jgi:hypothetical protein
VVFHKCRIALLKRGVPGFFPADRHFFYPLTRQHSVVSLSADGDGGFDLVLEKTESDLVPPDETLVFFWVA